ncbi:hypothetical protein GobsT_53820 [Gemmata obscuriglobus]|uniref:hypothetical protein n=1 Tax=Gemmata obscuriglobus TaxID=114 RepID=UPI0002E26318|nr:hypothetical protein [Gemmata obscuriglobus]QEG30577.1 hypothetical protein GobsT_53820 [Gemmata obscuriglobus]VTS09901.1 unnamed protein product [Gemmata obscuriglobus UQM 2246]
MAVHQGYGPAGLHDAGVATLRAAIDECLDRIPTDHRESLASLMTLKFQTFNSGSFLAV